MNESISVYGARAHNLKNIDIEIPRNKLVVVTGLSGSGKSSLAFDTLYAEGQRRYMETFSSYARQFIGQMERPDVDKIEGLAPVISIEQKTTSKSPRSTVGTITEVYDFLRLLYARASDAYSHQTGELMIRYTEAQIIELILEAYDGKDIQILAPLVRGRKGHYRELFEQIRHQGFVKARVDGQVIDIDAGFQVDRYKTHDIEVLIDRIRVSHSQESRLHQSVQTALKQGKGIVCVCVGDAVFFYSRHLMCPSTGISYSEPEPNTFSFNSPYGACPKCNGLGYIQVVDRVKIIPDPKLSIRKGGLAPLGPYKASWIYKEIETLGKAHGFTIDTPISELSEEVMELLLFGSQETVRIQNTYLGVNQEKHVNFEGIMAFIERHREDESAGVQKWAQTFTSEELCPECQGARLNLEARHFKINGSNISEVAKLDLSSFYEWIKDCSTHLSPRKLRIAKEILREIQVRLEFLLDVGIEYLSLDRPSGSLSGGEAQRIRLATQIGSKLRDVLYILDEPSIGLHQRDNQRLIQALKDLRDVGNSVLVVEHDRDMIMAADHVIDIGPGAGRLGGQVIAQGSVDDLIQSEGLTGQYLKGTRSIEIPQHRRQGSQQQIALRGCTGHNLKDIDLILPLGQLICITGVSGSGKSTLINGTLHPILSRHFYRSHKIPLPYRSIEGLELIDKVIQIDQSPIGRLPRSNPGTYVGVFDDIRKLFAQLPDARIRGYQPGRFSFNVKGGRCEACGGAGVQTIEMNFLPSVYVPCDVCNGKRYNRETLEVRFKGKSINDVLNLTIEQAVEFFENVPHILHKIQTLMDVGLGYITLGQPSTTLSGGEAQRVKLATELSKRDTGHTIYILDEPTTGLHFEDIRVLMIVLNRLVDRGNTVLVIEHQMDVIKLADHVIDIGPEGGRAGGRIVACGTPEVVAANPESYTGLFLAQELGINR